MFVRYYTHIPRPVEDVAHLLDDQPEHLLGGSADGNYERGGPVHLSLRVDGALPLSKEVPIRAGKTQHVADRAVLPITVVAAGSTGFFPRLEADLEVAPLGPNVTQLALSGTYRPPMGLVGDLVEKALLHRFAEAAVKDLIDQIGCRFTGAAPPSVMASALPEGRARLPVPGSGLPGPLPLPAPGKPR